MPSKSEAQAHFFAAVAHGWVPPGRKDVPSPELAKEWHAADKKVGKWEHPRLRQSTDKANGY